ncbi:hypothetical protein ACHAWX_006872 [Stephanocyclus meneghinianus]
MNSMNKVTVSRVAITYQPPMFKFEYTKGGRKLKYHKNINLSTRTFIQPDMSEFVADLRFEVRGRKNVAAAAAAKRISEVSEAITNALTGSYSELLQVPPSKIENLIKKLLLVNPMLIDNSVQTGPIERSADEQVQLNRSDGTGTFSVGSLRALPTFQCRNGVPNMINTSLSPSSSITEDEANEDSQDENMLEAQIVSIREREKLNGFGDLNKASEEDLQLAKNEMNEVYEKLRILPGDEEYVYDKRVDFEEPEEDSSWD